MGDERTETIRARLAAATPGPWWVEGNGSIKMDGRRDTYYVHANATDGRPFRVVAGNRSSEPDAQLVANAPSDLSYLLDENERLLALLRALEEVKRGQ